MKIVYISRNYCRLIAILLLLIIIIIIIIIITLTIAIIIIIITSGYLPVSTSQEAKGNQFNSPLTTILQSRNKKE